MDPRLRNLLGGQELAALRRRLRRHFERSEAPEAPARLRLNDLNTTEREALAVLTGRSPRDAKSIRIDVALLDAVLCRAGIARSLREALEQIDGPILHLASVRAAANAGWAAVVAACEHRALAAYVQAPVGLGLIKRLARQDPTAAAHLLQAACAVLRRLPAGGVARAQLAAETLGNAHALDDGQATATLVLAAWRGIEKEQSGTDDFDDPAGGMRSAAPDDPSDAALDPASDERRRDVWARAGVLVNELARPALLLNLRVQADETPVCTAGEPAYLSLRRLLRTPPRWAMAGRTVFVCENPNLLAIAADRLGLRCAPLACTEGMPAAAQRTLFTQLVQAGAHLRYHGDFDWPGIRIGNHVIRVWDARPWRFGAVDYQAAATSASRTQRDLAAACVAASWDAALAPAMQRYGLAIAEEAVASTLLDDLRL